MARESKGSPVLLIAGILSLLIAVGIALVVLRQSGPSAPPSAAGTKQAAPAAPKATPTPAVKATAAPTSTTPTLKPTAAPSPTAIPTTTPRPTQAASPTASSASMTLRGTIRNKDQEPVSSAQLYLIPKTDQQVADAVRTAFANKDAHSILTAGDDGVYTATIPARKAFILGLMVEGEPQPLVQEVSPGEPGAQVEANFVMPATYELRGTVSDEFTQLLSGVPLYADWQVTTLRREAAPVRRTAIETDSEGRFSLLLQEPAKVTIAINREKLPEPYLYEKDPLVLTRDDFRDGRIRRVDFELITGAVFEGRVVAGDGAVLLEGAEVTLRELDGTSPREWKQRADKTGSFRFPLLAPTTYLLRIEHKDYNTADYRDFKIADQKSGFTANLTPLASLVGTVEADGGVLPGAVVTLLDRYVDRRTEASVSLAGKVTYRFEKVNPGQYLLAGEHDSPDSHWYGEVAVTVNEKQEVEAPPLVLRRLHEVKGQLVGAPPGNDSRRVIVTAKLLDAPTDVAYEMNPGERRKLPIASTSDSGSFIVENLLEGRAYALTATDRQTKTLLGSARTEPGAANPVLLPLKGVGTLSGVVRTARGEACTGSEVKLTTGLGTLDGERGVPALWTARAGLDGTYRFENVPAGQSRLWLGDEEDAARIVNIPREGAVVIDMQCRVLLPIEFKLETASPKGFGPREQFLVVAKPGYPVKQSVQEMTAESPKLILEPAQYTITRTATMESQNFEVLPRLDGVVHITFTK